VRLRRIYDLFIWRLQLFFRFKVFVVLFLSHFIVLWIIRGGAGGSYIDLSSFNKILYKGIYRHGLFGLMFSLLIVPPIISYLSSLLFSYEFENRLFRFYLSLPISRILLFIVNILAMIVVIFIPMFSAQLVSSILLYRNINIFSSINVIISGLSIFMGYLFIYILYIISLSVLLNLILRSHIYATIFTSIIVFLLYFIGRNSRELMRILPPLSMIYSSPYPTLILSIIFLTISLILFRRIEAL